MHPFARILCNLGKREQFARIMNSVERYKNLYLFAQQKSRSNQRLFFYRQQKRRPPARTIAFINSCIVCARRES